MANSSARPLEVGSVIADTYTIEALIGKGGMGSVFLASHKRLPGKQVAIKLLHAELQEPDVIARFQREAQIATRLNHPNIVLVHDYNLTPDGTPYLVLEYLQGESLASRLVQGPLSLDTVFSIARQVGSALAAAHREGIVHRDLKPQNIFLVPTEVDGKVVEIAKVLDFGISKMRGSTTVKTQEATLLGTPQYMAPEQARGNHENVDARTDVFALGAIVYEMLAGHPAFSGETIPEVVFKVVYEQPPPLATEAPSAPSHVVATVNQAMSKAAAERFASVSTFIEKLTGEKVVTPPTRLPTPVPDDGSRVKSTGKEAFDATMNSVDGPQLLSPITPPPTPSQAINPAAQTVQSLPPDDHAARSPAADTPAPAARKSRVPMIAIAVAGAGIGALVLFLVMRGGGETAKPDAAVIAIADAAAIDAAPMVADAPVVADAAPVVADAVIADAKPVVADAAGPRADAAVVKEDDGGPGHAEVRQAMAALAARDFTTAERLANEVINSTTSAPGPVARARGVRGAVMCLAKDNEERARIELRQIPDRFRGAKAMLISACKQAGYFKN
jgi:eukaryotic-like serine/threonine-protein kinase